MLNVEKDLDSLRVNKVLRKKVERKNVKLQLCFSPVTKKREQEEQSLTKYT